MKELDFLLVFTIKTDWNHKNQKVGFNEKNYQI